MDSIVLFLKDDILPEKKEEVDKVRRKAPRFWLSEDKKLYKRSFFGPYLLCIHPEAVGPLLEELYDGICVEEYCHSIWDSLYPYLKQWTLV